MWPSVISVVFNLALGLKSLPTPKLIINSSLGLGEPSYFYIEAVFLLNGINMMVFFLFGSYLR